MKRKEPQGEQQRKDGAFRLTCITAGTAAAVVELQYGETELQYSAGNNRLSGGRWKQVANTAMTYRPIKLCVDIVNVGETVSHSHTLQIQATLTLIEDTLLSTQPMMKVKISTLRSVAF